MDLTPSYILGPTGPIAAKLEKYEPRPQQIEMAEAIQQAFEENKHLIIEGPTGVGKSFACILGAIKKAFETGTPVVISTHTIALQEQLFEKDIPFIKKHLNLPNLNVVLAKGRGNYVSLRRYYVAKSQLDKSIEFRSQFNDMDRWLEVTADGSLTTLPFKPSPTLWAKARSDSDQCYGERCSFFQKCHFQNSRRQLEKANIIITNHAMVLLDLKLRNFGMKLLPNYNYLIIDEAHELEKVARDSFTFEMNQFEIKNIFSEAYNDSGIGFLNKLQQKFISESLFSQSLDPSRKLILETADLMKKILNESDKLFQENVKNFLGTNKLKRFKEPKSIKSELPVMLKPLLANLKTLNESNIIVDKNEKIALDFICKRCVEIEDGLSKIIELPKLPDRNYSDVVAWASVESNPQNKPIYNLIVAPIFVKPILKSSLFSKIKSVVLTSATLATGGNDPFRMFRSAVGLDSGDNLLQRKLSSVFNYEKQAKLIIVDNMPEQSAPNYTQVMAEQVKKFVMQTKGNAFILFTSYKIMNDVYKKTETFFKMQGFPLFLHGGDLGRKQMVDQFKIKPNSVLFGNSSFWQGIDVNGNHLQNVIITKLPFDPPDDPLSEAQTEIYQAFNKNYFMERAVPQAAIKLKQGFGRLIRRQDDTGQVVLLDSRVTTRKYGSLLLDSLPKCPIIRERV